MGGYPTGLIAKNTARYVLFAWPGAFFLALVGAAVLGKFQGWDLSDDEVRIAGAVAGATFVLGNVCHGFHLPTERTRQIRAFLHAVAGLLGAFFFLSTLAGANVGWMVRIAAGAAVAVMTVLPAYTTYWELAAPHDENDERVAGQYYGILGAYMFGQLTLAGALAIALVTWLDGSSAVIVGLFCFAFWLIVGASSIQAAVSDYRDTAEPALSRSLRRRFEARRSASG